MTPVIPGQTFLPNFQFSPSTLYPHGLHTVYPPFLRTRCVCHPSCVSQACEGGSASPLQRPRTSSHATAVPLSRPRALPCPSAPLTYRRIHASPQQRSMDHITWAPNEIGTTVLDMRDSYGCFVPLGGVLRPGFVYKELLPKGGGGGHLGLTHTETQRGRLRTASGQRRVDSKNSQTTSTSSIRQLLGAADAQTAYPATFSTAPAHQLLGSANAETTPARAPAAAADRTERPDATCGGKNG